VVGTNVYWENFVFVIFNGIGHMIPEWQPEGAYKMIDAFLFERWLD